MDAHLCARRVEIRCAAKAAQHDASGILLRRGTREPSGVTHPAVLRACVPEQRYRLRGERLERRRGSGGVQGKTRKGRAARARGGEENEHLESDERRGQ